MNQPPFVGPPPTPPREPRVRQPQHVVHVILSLITGGLWLPIWALATLDASRANRHAQERYDDERAKYQVDYDEWQRRYHQVYGGDPRIWR